MADPQAGQSTSRSETLAKLEREEERLSRQIAQAHGQKLQTEAWVELEAIRQALAADETLVDIARFEVFDFSVTGNDYPWRPPRYAAWIVPPAGQGAIQIVDLGEAKPIEEATLAVRKALFAAPATLIDAGESEAEAALKQPLSELARLVFEPLREHLGESHRLIISPDVALWLVPWGALPLADGRYAIEQYQIGYVVSSRDLLAQPSTNAQTAQPIIMADPNYDLGPKDTLAATAAVLRTAKPATVQTRSLDTISPASGLTKVARLPGTAQEARAVTPKLQAYSGAAPLVYTDQWALEGVFKAIKRPKALVLCTHGFFLPGQPTKKGDGETSPDARSPDAGGGKAVENPLLRCGLLLAGCNARDQAAAAGAEDGVLTGMEIVGMDLRGTELVVLSACETGLGQLQVGEGVAGLRQAFQLAGAQAVVATLWQIPDEESAELMTGFFNNLAAGQSKADALRNAQLSLIKNRRQRGAAHPFFWAAYTITGQ